MNPLNSEHLGVFIYLKYFPHTNKILVSNLHVNWKKMFHVILFFFFFLFVVCRVKRAGLADSVKK